jgi:hypothetical protein
MSKFRLVLLAVLGLAVLGLPQLLSVLEAQQQSSGQDAEDPDVLFAYSGGAQEGVRKRTENAANTWTSTAYGTVPGATLSWFVPAGDSDLLNVSFEAECRLIGGNNPSRWVEMRAQISASPAVPGYPTFLQPYDTGSVQAFCSADLYAMHHASWARRVVAPSSFGVNYTVTIQRRVNTAGTTAWLDDWEMALHASN